MHSYALSSRGKRTTLALLIGALIVWAFALWTFRSTVGSIPGEPVGFFAALGRNLTHGLSLGQLIPALLTLALVLATPLVFWNLLADYAAVYTLDQQHLHYRTVGVALGIPLVSVAGVRDETPADERGSTLLVKHDLTQQIANPVSRLCYRLCYGRMSLPIPAELEGREHLLAALATYASATFPAEAAAVAGEPN